MPLYWGTQKIGEVHTENHEHIWVDINNIYPIGSVYISVTSSNPSELFGGTWERIKDTFLLAAGDTYTAGTTGGSATVTLTTTEIPSHDHTVGAHAHGLNSHKHSIPALSGTAAGNGGHSHTPPDSNFHFAAIKEISGRSGTNRVTGADGQGGYGFRSSSGWGDVTTPASTNSVSNHTHSVTTTANTSGAASGNTANSTAFNTGAKGGGGAHENMPPYLAVYIWKRVA